MKPLSKRVTKPTEDSLAVASVLMSAVQAYAALVARVPESEAQRRKEQRWANAWQHFRVLVSIFEWRYVLIPVGIRDVSQPYLYGDNEVWVNTRQLHVFGFRVARWYVGRKVYTEKISVRTSVPLKRYRLRRRRGVLKP
jgi:hypothetical protein